MTSPFRWLVLSGLSLVVVVTDSGQSAAPPSPSTQPAQAIIDRIRDQGLNHSQVMATLDMLCNVIGPRLTASPAQVRASNWTRDQLSQWGLINAHLEPWGKFGRGWMIKRFEAQVLEPTAVDLVAIPKAWSPGIDGPVQAEVVWLDARSRDDLEKYRGKLRGKVVLLGQPRVVSAHFDPQAARMDDVDLKKLANAASGADIGVAELMRTNRGPTTQNSRQTGATTAPASRPYFAFGARAFAPTAITFAASEGALLVLDPSSQGDGGTVYVAQASLPRAELRSTTGPASQPADQRERSAAPRARPQIWADDAPATVPQATVAAEQYNRMVSQIKAGENLKMSVDLRVEFTPTDPAGPADTIAEIPGSDLKDQMVMVGGHLDSWHGGTGATDNAAGAASAMEAVRILKALDLHPRRTIRVALWTGEEEGLYGSTAYVTNHFGKVEDQPTTRPTTRLTSRMFRRPAPKLVKGPEYENLSVYFNLDNGTGKIRGIYAQGNKAAGNLFQQWLAPVRDLGATTVTLSNTDSTDHIPFDDIGLPGFQFIQDPIEYGTRTHHSNADVYERLQPDDLRQASTVMAIFVWNAANMQDRFPRK